MDFGEGMKFWPKDEILIGYYLHGRNEGSSSLEILPGTIYDDIDVYATEPWNLPSECFTHGEHGNQAFFFTHRPSKAAGRGGVRARRTAGSGTWHGQGHLTSIDSIPAGHKTTLTFKNGDGKMTDWLMQEYVLDSPSFQTLALCRIYKKHRAVAASRGRKRPCNQQQPSAQKNDRHQLLDPCPKRSRVLGEIPCTSPAAVDPSIWEEPSLAKFHEQHLLSTGATTASSSEHLQDYYSPIPVPPRHDDTIYLDHEYEPVQQDYSSTIPAPSAERSDQKNIICFDDGGEINLDDFFNSFPQVEEEEEEEEEEVLAHAHHHVNIAANVISQEEPAAPPCADPQEQLLARISNLSPPCADHLFSIQECSTDNDLLFSHQDMSFQQLLAL